VGHHNGKALKFAHVVYSTRRLEEMVDWYKKVFEATVAYQNLAFAFLTYDDEHHRFAFANLSVLSPSSEVPPRGKEGVNHVAYTYANLGRSAASLRRSEMFIAQCISLERTSPLGSSDATSERRKDFRAVTSYKHLVPTERKLVVVWLI
jgi:catechol-2,3-dioxygenase